MSLTSSGWQVSGGLSLPPGLLHHVKGWVWFTLLINALPLFTPILNEGDSVLYADLDYDSMQACMESLARRRGAQVRRVALPEPATRQGLIDAYAQAMADAPRLKLILK